MHKMRQKDRKNCNFLAFRLQNCLYFLLFRSYYECKLNDFVAYKKIKLQILIFR